MSGRDRAATLDPGRVNAAPGRQWCEAWSDQVDAALSTALSTCSEQHQSTLAVVALGGYARRQLCPASDVDVLLLHDGWSRPDLAGAVEALCYPLWDAGLRVGHTVATPRQAVASASDDLTRATALTDRRLVAGGAGLVDDLAVRLRRWLRRRAGDVLLAVERDTAERHRAAGDRVGLLEPDLKDGVGGLRDVHTLRWAGACVLGTTDPDALVGAQYLGADDRRRLAEAVDVVLGARCAVHLGLLASGSRLRGEVDRLRLDLQADAAQRLGAVDDDALARDVGTALRTIAAVRGRAWPALMSDARGGRRRRGSDRRVLDDEFALTDGLLEVRPAAILRTDPSLALRAGAVAAARGTRLARGSLQRLRREVTAQSGALPWSAGSLAALLGILRTGSAARAVLADLDDIGVLTAHLPDWAAVRGQPQRNPLHRYDVDTHGLEAVIELLDLAADRHQAIWQRLADPDGLLLATWLHDIGKAWPGDHSQVGAERAADWLQHMGVDAARRRRVAWLIRHHLLLPDAATGRDLDDPGELSALARTVGTADALDSLYLLSMADGRATGPAASGPWRDELLATLHHRVRALLTGPSVASGRHHESVREGATARLLAGLPMAYRRSVDGAALREHAALVGECAGDGTARARVTGGPAPSTTTATLVALDRSRLLADAIGLVTTYDAAILEARAFTHRRGIVIDWFVLAGLAADAVALLAEQLAAAADGHLDVPATVGRWRRRQGPSAAPDKLPVGTVTVAEGTVARIETRGPDAPDRLYRLAQTFADLGVEVAAMRAVTLSDEVRHTWFCRGLPAGLRGDDLAARMPEHLAAGACDRTSP